jgi:hypothetical protein
VAAIVSAEGGDLRARVLLDENEGLAGALGWMTPTAQLGWLAIEEGRQDDAELHLRMLVDRGAGWGGYHLAAGLFGIGQVTLRRGDMAHARALYCQFLVDLRESELCGLRLADGLVYLASVHPARGGDGRIWQPNARGR